MTIGLRSTNRSDLSYSTRGDDIPTGEVILFYADTAPIGYTLKAGMNDKAVFVTSGSGNGGQTGGGAHSTGTWTQPNHTHTGPSHRHATQNHPHELDSSIVGGAGYTADGYVGNIVGQDQMRTRGAGGQSFYVFEKTIAASGGGNTTYAGTEATGGGATVNTWRPASYCFIACERD